MNRPKAERLIGNNLRDRLRVEQNNLCHWCGGEMDDPGWGYPRPARSVTLDHIQPRATGGPLTPSNCVAACHQCNARRNLEATKAAAPLRSKIDKALRNLSPAEQVERLVRVATEIENAG